MDESLSVQMAPRKWWGENLFDLSETGNVLGEGVIGERDASFFTTSFLLGYTHFF
jgi:hypothetical protein